MTGYLGAFLLVSGAERRHAREPGCAARDQAKARAKVFVLAAHAIETPRLPPVEDGLDDVRGQEVEAQNPG